MPRNPAIATVIAAVLFVAAAPSTRADEPLLQCVPYARQVSGIEIYGDAHSWWQQADGRYARGNRPVPGAVMAFKPYRSMQLGHVAAVSRVLDSRRVLLDHANWSPVNGRKGQIERNVLAEDVSSANDWSEVRVWYAPIGALGTTRYPIYGFIYPQGRGPGLRAHPPVQIVSDDGLSDRARRKAQRAAEKAERKARKLAEKEQKALAREQREQSARRQASARAAAPVPPAMQADPIGDLIGRVGG